MKKVLASILLLTNFNLLAFSNPVEVDLSQYEKCVYSQNGEDGVIEKIFKLIGTSSKYYLEFGGHDGITASNSRRLRRQFGWTGLLLDGGYENPAINLYKEYITAENINELFAKYNVPGNLDFLSIDIDYNDFYVWKALDKKYQPRLIVVEYNATHLPFEDKVVEYSPMFSGDATNYYGASILAFYNLGRSKGYSLVYAEKQGVNLFFVRDDLVSGPGYTFKNVNDVEKLYAFPKYGKGPNGGHKADPLFREYLKSTDLLK
jgi:hypothetical protein